MLKHDDVLHWLNVEHTVSTTLKTALQSACAARAQWWKRQQLCDLVTSFAMDSKGDEARYVLSVITFMDNAMSPTELSNIDANVNRALEARPPKPLELTQPGDITRAKIQQGVTTPIKQALEREKKRRRT